MKSLAKTLVLIFLFLSFESTASALDIEISILAKEFHARAPFSFRVSVALEASDTKRFRSVVLRDSDIQMELINEKHEKISVTEKPSWVSFNAMNSTWQMPFNATTEGAHQTRDYLLNKWFSTNVAPGKYTLAINIPKVMVNENGIANTREYRFEKPFAAEFQITVNKENPFYVDEYENALKTLKSYPAKSWTPELRDRLNHAADVLAYTHEPTALPFQLKLFRDEVILMEPGLNEFHLADLSTYFVDTDNIEAAKSFVEWMKSPPTFAQNSTRQFISDLIVWTLQRMHAKGNPEIVTLTDEIVKQHPKPLDPRIILGFH